MTDNYDDIVPLESDEIVPDESDFQATDSLAKIPSHTEAIEQAEKEIEALKKIKVLSIRLTKESDWVNQAGRPDIMDSGARAIAQIWGVDISGISIKKDWLKDSKGEYYAYTATGHGYSKRLGRHVEEIGTCSQRDKFFAKKKGEWLETIDIDEMNIKKKAVTNLSKRIITALVGLRNVTWEMLEEAGLRVSEITKVEYKSAEGDPTKGNRTPSPKGGSTPPAASDKPASSSGPQDDKKDPERRKEVWDALLTICSGDEDEAGRRLKNLSGFESKKDGSWVDGKSNVKDLSGKWLYFVHKKIMAKLKEFETME